MSQTSACVFCIRPRSLPRVRPKIVAVKLFDRNARIGRQGKLRKTTLVSHFHREIDQHIAKQSIDDLGTAFGFHCKFDEVMPKNDRSLPFTQSFECVTPRR